MNSFPDIVLTLDFFDTTDNSTSTRTMILENVSADGDDFGSRNRALNRLTKSQDSNNPLYKII